MTPRIKIGVLAALLCLIMPFLARLPRGIDWVAQYLPDEGHVIVGSLFFFAFALIPAVVVFCAALVSKAPYYFPLLFSTVVSAAMLAYWHHGNDLAADAQAAISLIFIPIYVALLGLAAGVTGVGFQFVAQWLKAGSE